MSDVNSLSWSHNFDTGTVTITMTRSADGLITVTSDGVIVPLGPEVQVLLQKMWGRLVRVDIEKLDLKDHGKTINQVVRENTHEWANRPTFVNFEEIARRVITGIIRDLALEGYDIGVEGD